jgi:hypothetical protein
MKSSAGTEALVALEDEAPDSLFARLPDSDVAVWPQLRWPLATSSAEVEWDAQAVPGSVSLVSSALRFPGTQLPRATSALRIPHDRDVLFITSGTTFTRTDNGIRNWLTDGFAEVLGDRGITLQDRPLSRGSSTPATATATYSFDGALHRAHARGLLTPLSGRDRVAASSAIRDIYRHFDFPVDESRRLTKERQVIQRLRRAPYLKREMERVLDRVRPKVVVMQGAAYGSRASAIALMKERGIAVVEPQHGWIGPSHGAYNFGRAMATPELSQYLPDHLLTFGTFWSEQIRFPAPTTPIGKPELWDAARGVRAKNGGPQVLVVSSVHRPEEATRRVLAIRDALPADWCVIFRPHPSERTTIRDRYPDLVCADRVTFDQNLNVYDSLTDSSAVIGVASTVLYEALALGRKVIVLSSPIADQYLPPGLFGEPIASTKSIQAAMERIQDQSIDASPHPQALIDSFWTPEPVENFKRFITPLLTIVD